MMADKYEPLLLGDARRPSKDLTRTQVSFIFCVLGLCSSILWNQLLLSVGLLVELFGDEVISIAATSQNLLCTVVMWVLTFAPASVAMKARGAGDQHRMRQISLAIMAVACMLCLGAALVVALLVRRLPLWLLVALVAIDGAATGAAQIVGASLAGMLSGTSSDAAGALLLGEAAAPLLTALCAALVSLQPALGDAYESTLVALSLPMGVLMLALVALRMLYRSNPPGGVPLECKTLGIAGSDASGAALISRRVRALLPNAACVSALCAVWIFLLCSTPTIAAGLCRSGTSSSASGDGEGMLPSEGGGEGGGGELLSDPQLADERRCVVAVPSLMVGVSNVSAFLGRLIGAVLPPICVPGLGGRPTSVLAVETIAVVMLSLGAVFAAETLSEGEGGGMGGVGDPSVVGGTLSAVVTLWCNALLMRLSSVAQRSAGSEHNIMCPCPITAQISWVAIQTGCVGGSALSFVLRAGPA